MAIRGAIFDCDGTLLDSMPMWTECCVSLLERYGVQDAYDVFAAHESLDMDKKCYWYHDNLGIGESGEALYRELWDMVQEAYRRRVEPYEGCKALLDELRARNIPCITLSSTPTALLRTALEDHGLLEYFHELVFVGDVGRGKEYSDCYVAAGHILGTPREDTWVFEDAPFGVRSAARAGFPTVAVVNDHDGRDETFMSAWSTILVRTYEHFPLARLQEEGPRLTRALVVAGSPEPSAPGLVKALAATADLVIAADKGVDVLHAAQVVPDLYCGDEDSASPTVLAWAKQQGTRMERHPVEKDDTDLGLAIARARTLADERQSALRLTLTCASGGRPDHALGVLGALLHAADACPRLVEDGFECRLLAPEGARTWLMAEDEGATFSALALLPGTVVSEKGMRWELDHEELAVLDDRGVSNRIVAKNASASCASGALAAFKYPVLHG